MITCIIGHRGSGKTSLLQRLESYYSQAPGTYFFDLDKYIETHELVSIADIFSDHGEEHFRELERKYFYQLHEHYKSHNTFISLGAGFHFALPEDIKVLWLRRPLDAKGRVFVDRPTLEKKSSPLEEYFIRFKKREALYHKIYDEIYYLPEGFTKPSELEQKYFLDLLDLSQESVTVQAEIFDRSSRLENFLEFLRRHSFKYVELRDDLLNDEQIRILLKKIPAPHLLLSFRRTKPSQAFIDFLDVGTHRQLCKWDWPLELGPCTLSYGAKVISLHELQEGESIQQATERLEKHKWPGRILKFSPLISAFEDLKIGDTWLKQDSLHCFLPRSTSGRWNWYRLLRKTKNPLHFVAFWSHSAVDQPLLLESLKQNLVTSHYFAAVLGSPVKHSFTPGEQAEFFAPRDMNVYAIDMFSHEWQHTEWLRELGLSHAAVTSPLKKHAFTTSDERTQVADELESVNTLYFSPQKIAGTNTDIDGLKQLFAPYKDSPKIVLWGGGGTLNAVKKVLPQVVAYSVREQKPRSAKQAPLQPDIVIWAYPRSQVTGMESYPPLDWQPSVVIDLNYTEDSPGREYALMAHAKYISGMTLFQEQAKYQREFWHEYSK